MPDGVPFLRPKIANQFRICTPVLTLKFVTAKKRMVAIVMKKPKIFADSGWSQSWIELSILYSLTSVATALLLDMHWLVAMSVAPGIMMAMLLAVMAFVQILWMLVVGVERIGSALGMSKSPLS